jgi:hypothetical protein
MGLTKQFACIDTIRLGELSCRLPRCLCVEDPLQRIEHIAPIFRRRDVGERPVLVNHCNNLCNLDLQRIFGVLDSLYPGISLLGQTSQIVLEALHAVVRGAVRTFLAATFFRDPACTNLTPAKRVAEVVDGDSVLTGKWSCASIS